MHRLKMFGAITAVYLGLYLVLPGCLCQLLLCFGVVSPAPSAVSGDSSYVLGPGADTICHCHEVSAKTVEAPQSHESAPSPIQGYAAVTREGTTTPALLILIKSGGPRAPPIRLRAPSSLRSFTGVYLI